MVEPTTTSGIAIWAASLSAASLALFGVDSYALMWGLIGAICARGRAESLSWLRAVFYVALSMLLGAALGTGFQAVVQVVAGSMPSRALQAMLVAGSCVGGYGSQRLLDALVSGAVKRIHKFGDAQ
jgi:hypothetical protein